MMVGSYVARRDEQNLIIRLWDLEVGGKRTEIRWKDVVMNNVSGRKLDASLASDRNH